jgi:hypothetical protein
LSFFCWPCIVWGSDWGQSEQRKYMANSKKYKGSVRTSDNTRPTEKRQRGNQNTDNTSATEKRQRSN